MRKRFKALTAALEAQGVNLERVREALWARTVETAGWNYISTGSRFHIHPAPGAARNIWEKVDDAGAVQKLVGICPELAINSVGDLAGVDPQAVRTYAAERGIRIGSVTPNLARDVRFRYGSITHRDPAIRASAVALIRQAIDAAGALRARSVTLWLHDGSHYPGQIDFRKRKQWAAEALRECTAACPPALDFLLEYKLFEPGPYHTDVADWGMAYVLARAAGERVRVLVDLGHHAQGVNIEHLTAFLLDEGMLGGFHLNDRKSADDDLTVGSIAPYQLFLIFAELTHPANGGRSLGLTLDQHHTGKPPILATVQSLMRTQEIYLKALLIDWAELARCREADDSVGAEQVLQEAFAWDVRPLLAVWREERGLPADPMAALRSSGILAERERTRS